MKEPRGRVRAQCPACNAKMLAPAKGMNTEVTCPKCTDRVLLQGLDDISTEPEPPEAETPNPDAPDAMSQGAEPGEDPMPADNLPCPEYDDDYDDGYDDDCDDDVGSPSPSEDPGDRMTRNAIARLRPLFKALIVTYVVAFLVYLICDTFGCGDRYGRGGWAIAKAARVLSLLLMGACGTFMEWITIGRLRLIRRALKPGERLPRSLINWAAIGLAMSIFAGILLGLFLL